MLSGSANIALDLLRLTKPAVYRRSLDDLRSYLDARASTDTTPFTIEDPSAFVHVLNEMPDEGPFEELVRYSAPDCRIDDLQQVPARVWPALTGAERIPATFANLHCYLDEYSEVDAPLANLLRTTPITAVPDDDFDARYDLAVAILNAREHLHDTAIRVQLALQLKLESTLDLTDLQPEPGDLVAELLRVGLLEDSADSFAATYLPDWPTREDAIAASERFEEFMSPELIPVSQIGSLFSSTKIPDRVKQHALADLSSYTKGATPEAFAAISAAAVRNDWQLQFGQIDVLIVGGLRTPQAVVHLVNTSGPLLETSHVHQLLNRLGGDYARLTTIGARPIYFPNDELHVNLLDRLMQEGNVSTFVETKDRSNLKVNLRRK